MVSGLKKFTDPVSLLRFLDPLVRDSPRARYDNLQINLGFAHGGSE